MIKYIILGTMALGSVSKAKSDSKQQAATVAALPGAAQKQLSENEKIEKLIHYVSNLDGATFVRNGSNYDPKMAAEHLKSKFNKHASKIKTAGDFITLLATKSSASGKFYTIKLADGTIVELHKLLNQELQRIEQLARVN